MKKIIKSLILAFLVSVPIHSQDVHKKIDYNPEIHPEIISKNAVNKSYFPYGSIGLTTQWDYFANSVYQNSIIFDEVPYLVTLVMPFLPFPANQRHIVFSTGTSTGSFSHQSVFGWPAGAAPSIDIKRTGSDVGLIGITSTPNLLALKVAPDSFIVKTLPGLYPAFVFSNDKILLVSKVDTWDLNLYRSFDWGNSFDLILSVSDFHPSPIFGLMSGEYEIFKSPTEQHIVILGTNEGNGQVYSGTPENEANNVWIIYSNDFGNNWTGKTIGVDGKPNSVSGYHTPNFAPLFGNFQQVSGTVSDNGVIHIIANGYGVVLDSPSGSTEIASSFPVLYWNSITENWIAVSSIAVDTIQSIRNYYPPNSIGQAYPSISVSDDGQAVYAVWTGPQLTATGELDIANNGSGYMYYWRDLYHSYSVDSGLNWSNAAPITSMNTPFSDIFGQASKYLKTINASTYRANIRFLIDYTTGVAPFDAIFTDNDIIVDYVDIMTTGVDDDLIAENYTLMQNYPNPFNPATKIKWQLPVGSWQTIKVFDVLGREVATLIDEFRNAGSYEVEFDAAGLSSGIYIYTLKSGSFFKTRKMLVLK